MATITRTQSLPDLATKSDFHSIIDTATVTNIVEADVNSSNSIVTVSAVAPSSPKLGQHWFRTDPASNMGIDMVYDGQAFRPMAVGFLGRYISGTVPFTAGGLVLIDTGAAAITGGNQVPVTATTSRGQIPAGVNLIGVTALNQEVPIIFEGKFFGIRKTAAAVTIAQAIVPADSPPANAGEATGNNSFGSSAIGFWLESTSSTTGQGLLRGSMPSSYLVSRTQATLLFRANPATLGLWSGSWPTPQTFVWPIDNAGTKAHLVEARLMYGPTAQPTLVEYIDCLLAIRPTSSGGDSTTPSLWPHIAGVIPGASFPTSPTINRLLVNQMLIPHSTGGATQGEVFVRAVNGLASPATAGFLLLELYDRGHVAGGAVL